MREYTLEDISKAYLLSYDDLNTVLFDEVLKDVPDKIHESDNFKEHVKNIKPKVLSKLYEYQILIITAYCETINPVMTFDNIKSSLLDIEYTEFMAATHQNDPDTMAMIYIDKAIRIAVLRKLESM